MSDVLQNMNGAMQYSSQGIMSDIECLHTITLDLGTVFQSV